jgi:trans-aconitate methyltransferase
MQQTWDTSVYAQDGRFVAQLAESLLETLQPRPGEHILDLGCGDGFLTQRIAEAGAAVLGVDSSVAMIAATRRRGLPALCANAATLNFAEEFDAVFSNAALHWMDDQHAVLENVRRALKPGGRFVAEMGGHGNVAAIRVALLAVFGPRKIPVERIECNCFYTPAEYHALLEGHGFRVESIHLIPRPTPLPAGIRGWLELFRAGLLNELSPAERTQALEEIVALLKPVLCDGEGNWTADYVRLRFAARRA